MAESPASMNIPDLVEMPDLVETPQPIETIKLVEAPDTTVKIDTGRPVEPAAFDWYDLVSQCNLTGISGNILWNCVPVVINADHYVLTLDEQQSALFSADHAAIIGAALSDHLKQEIRVDISIGQVLSETPAARRRREKAETMQALHKRFYEDHGVMALVAGFDATIDQESFTVKI